MIKKSKLNDEIRAELEEVKQQVYEADPDEEINEIIVPDNHGVEYISYHKTPNRSQINTLQKGMKNDPFSALISLARVTRVYPSKDVFEKALDKRTFLVVKVADELLKIAGLGSEATSKKLEND